MMKYGGNQNIISMKRIIELSREEAMTNGKGPYDIIYTGGESGGCDVACGVGMMMNETLQQIALNNYREIGDCAYAINKTLLLPPQWLVANKTGVTTNPVAIKNSLGGIVQPFCDFPVDYESYRDVTGNLSSPDSAVMIRVLFADKIKEHASKDEILSIRQAVAGGKYLAAQFRSTSFTAQAWAQSLDRIHNITKLPTILFQAGSAPGHDRLSYFHEVKKHMKSKCRVLHTANVWKVVALISAADVVIGTSLHVRIMAFIYHKPRVMLGIAMPKFNIFTRLWEAYPYNTTVQDLGELELYVAEHRRADMKPTAAAVRRAVAKYRSNFRTWSKLLNQ
jgi:hypothetical protein